MIVWEDDGCSSIEEKGSSLFEIFCENYAINEVQVFFKNDVLVFVKKYNVLGWDNPNDYFTLYEDSSKNNRLCVFRFDSVKRLEI